MAKSPSTICTTAAALGSTRHETSGMEDVPHTLLSESQATPFEPQLRGCAGAPALRVQGRLPCGIVGWGGEYCAPADLRGHLRSHGGGTVRGREGDRHRGCAQTATVRSRPAG